jgi:hypothetical protein
MSVRARQSAWAFVLSTAIGGSASANPISSYAVRVRQVPHTAHVQVTCAVLVGLNVDPAVERNGRALSARWLPVSTYTTNVGSGLMDLSAVQHCDCDVPLGQQRYRVHGTLTYSDENQELFDVDVEVEVVEDLDDPPDAGPPAADVDPWDVLDPTEIQGVDCAEVCANPPARGAPLASESRADEAGGGQHACE